MTGMAEGDLHLELPITRFVTARRALARQEKLTENNMNMKVSAKRSIKPF